MTQEENVRSLADLGRVTAAALRGQGSPYLTTGDIDSETAPIAEALARMCERGYVTTCSQPAYSSPDGMGHGRAFVTGLCNEEVACVIQAATVGTDLVAILHPPGAEHWATVLVGTMPEPDPPLSLGRACADEDADSYGEYFSEELAEAVREAWMVEVFDAHWGRDDLLWSSLLRALTGGHDAAC